MCVTGLNEVPFVSTLSVLVKELRVNAPIIDSVIKFFLMVIVLN